MPTQIVDGTPSLTRDQIRRVDLAAVERLGMSSLVLMENAGRGCVDLLEHIGIDGPVVVCCYKGNNGGDGFVIARHLLIRGYRVEVALFSRPEELTGDALANLNILRALEAPVDVLSDSSSINDLLPQKLERAKWIVDALLGTGASGDPRNPVDDVIQHINESPAPCLAVDVPSGLDCDTGQPGNPTVQADHTCTFVAPKPGLLAKGAAAYVGQLHIADIGVPAEFVQSVIATE